MINSSISRLTELLKVIHLAEDLKRELRHSWLSDGRQESVAEHTWRVCLMAILLEPELCHKIDGSRTLRMIVVHDIVEIFAGDVPIFSASTPELKEQKRQKELEALQKIIAILPESTGEMLGALWHEFEDNLSVEAQFAHALDKLEAQIQHNEADISTWLEWEIGRAFGGLRKICATFPALATLNSLVEAESKEKIVGAGIDIVKYKD